MAYRKKSQFIDKQILLAITHFNVCTIIDLLFYCIDNYELFDWDYHKIRNSITRLSKKNKIEFCYCVTDYDYEMNNKIWVRPRTMRYFYLKNN